MQTFVQIRGISNERRLPRLGKIRLGVKVRNAQTGKEHPAETEYFVVPPEVAKVYGDNPTALDIMFPVNDPGVVFPQALKWYGSGRGLKCIGNGHTAMRLNDATHTMEQRECPCEHLNQDCGPRASLQVMLPKVSMGGVYQIDSGSWNSMVDLNSYFDYLTALIGRFAMVQLILRREPKQIQGPTGLKTHYPLKLELTATQEEVQQLRGSSMEMLQRIQCWQVPPPEEVNPAKDEGAVVVTEDDWQHHDGASISASRDAATTHHLETPVPQEALPHEPTTSSDQSPQNSADSSPDSSSPSTNQRTKTRRGQSHTQNGRPATQKQRTYILQLTGRKHIPVHEVESRLTTMTKAQASSVITQLQNQDYRAFEAAEGAVDSPMAGEPETIHAAEGPTDEPEF